MLFVIILSNMVTGHDCWEVEALTGFMQTVVAVYGYNHVVAVDMALLKYVQREGPVLKCDTCSAKEMEQMNRCTRRTLDKQTNGKKHNATHGGCRRRSC